MKKLVIRRLLAGMIDYGLAMIYALILLTIFSAIYNIWNINPASVHPMVLQIAGFSTITIPIFLYFFMSENYPNRATIGKRFLKIKVSPGNIFLRNVLKLLPWEVGHRGVQWMIYYDDSQLGYPYWVWGLLITPLLVMLVYWVSIIRTEGKSSLYDHWANCHINRTWKANNY